MHDGLVGAADARDLRDHGLTARDERPDDAADLGPRVDGVGELGSEVGRWRELRGRDGAEGVLRRECAGILRRLELTAELAKGRQRAAGVGLGRRLGERDVLDGRGRLALEVVGVVAVVALEVGVADLDLAVGHVGVAERDEARVGPAGAADELALDLGFAHADAGVDHRVQLGLAAPLADLLLQRDELRLQLRVLIGAVDELAEARAVHAALAVGEQLADDGVRVVARDELDDLGVGDLDPEAFHLLLAERVVHERVEDLVLDLGADGLGDLDALLLVELHALLDGLVVELGRDLLAVHDGDVAASGARRRRRRTCPNPGASRARRRRAPARRSSLNRPAGGSSPSCPYLIPRHAGGKSLKRKRGSAPVKTHAPAV